MVAIIQSKIFCLPVKEQRTEDFSIKTINSPFVLNECVFWSVTLREEHRLRVFQNMVEVDIWI